MNQSHRLIGMTSNPNTLTETDILKKNVRDLEEQLHNAYKRIDELTAQVIDLQREQSVNLGKSYS